MPERDEYGRRQQPPGGRAEPSTPIPQRTGVPGDPQDRGLRNPATETSTSVHLDELMQGVAEPISDIGQDIDGGLSAQPKANLSGGFDPIGERLQPALRAGATGTEEGVDVMASSTTVVSDADAELDQLEGVRDATSYESGEAVMTLGNRGNLPLPEEPRPVRDDTKGHRPHGTPEMGFDQESLRTPRRRQRP